MNATAERTRFQDLQISRAAQRRREISKLGTRAGCIDQVKRCYQTVKARGMDYIESRFFLGAAVAQYDLIAKHGDGFVRQLSIESNVSQPILRESLRFFDTFGGDVEKMYEWANQFVQEHGSLMAGDVKQLVQANTERSDLAREVRRHNGATGDELGLEDVSPPEVEASKGPTRRKQIPQTPRDAFYRVVYDGEPSAEVEFEQEGGRYRMTLERLS